MSTHHVVGSLVVGAILVASCARADDRLQSPALSPAHQVDAGAAPKAIADRDNDGIPDGVDRCPDAPSPASSAALPGPTSARRPSVQGAVAAWT